MTTPIRFDGTPVRSDDNRTSPATVADFRKYIERSPTAGKSGAPVGRENPASSQLGTIAPSDPRVRGHGAGSTADEMPHATTNHHDHHHHDHHHHHKPRSTDSGPPRGQPPATTKPPHQNPSSTPPGAADGQPPIPKNPGAETQSTSLDEAQAKTNPQFLPVLRGDEQTSDAQVTNEHDFGQLVDKTAKEYGLDPAMFRAQLQSESGAFNGPDGYKAARHAVGDTKDAPDVSIGYGQIRMNYLNNGPWAKDGTNNDRLGDQTVTTDQYNNSITTQVRMAAAIDAERIADNGGSVEKGLAVYVSGSPDTSASKAQAYLQNIEKAMNDPNVENV